jgi:hypothetical protein
MPITYFILALLSFVVKFQPKVKILAQFPARRAYSPEGGPDFDFTLKGWCLPLDNPWHSITAIPPVVGLTWAQKPGILCWDKNDLPTHEDRCDLLRWSIP